MFGTLKRATQPLIVSVIPFETADIITFYSNAQLIIDMEMPYFGILGGPPANTWHQHQQQQQQLQQQPQPINLSGMFLKPELQQQQQQIVTNEFKIEEVFVTAENQTNHGNEQPTFECDTCYKTYSSMKSLKRHLKEVHGKEMQTNKSYLSNKTVKRQFKNYQLQQQQQQQHQLLLQRQQHLQQQHQQQQQQPIQTFKCSMCFRVYASYRSLQMHMRFHQEEEEGEECEICHRSYSSNKSLRRHMKEYHGDDEVVSAKIQAYFDCH